MRECSGASRLFDRLEESLAQRALVAPRQAVVAAGALGWLRNALSRRWPAPREVAALLATGPRRSASLSRSIAADAARNRLCVRLAVRDRVDVLETLAHWPTASSPLLLPRPAILAVFHLGAHQALGLGLAEFAAPILLVRWTPLPTGGGERVEVVSTHGGLEIRSAALKRALDKLRAGGIVLSALDGEEGSRLTVRCLGRDVAIGSGAFFLARRAGAPIFPYTAAWHRGRVHFELHEALESPPDAEGFEAAQARIAAIWLERFLARRPEQLSLGLLRMLLSSS